MHVMFIHPNFPAQFGHIAVHLATQLGWKCSFVTSVDTRHIQLPITHINYKLKPGEPLPQTFYNPGSLDGLLEHLAAIYRGLRTRREIQPDLVVGHASYGTMLYLRNLYSCPFIGYFEMLPPPFWSEALSLRREYPATEGVRLFNATYHALTYLHLHAVEGAYSPTHWQRSTAPAELQHKIRVIFDGVDVDYFKPAERTRPAEFRGLSIGPNTRVVTYVSRGLESMRGFDIFMKVAKRICAEIPDVLFLVAGEERTNYGHELHHLPKGVSFKQYVLSQDQYDLDRIRFLGRIPTDQLTRLYQLSDLHVYLTAPYVLSWSMVQAMASSCTLLVSNTAPVREFVEPDRQALMADFDDVDSLAEKALAVLRRPADYQELGKAARQRVLERYEKKHCIDQLVAFFREVTNRPPSAGALARA